MKSHDSMNALGKRDRWILPDDRLQQQMESGQRKDGDPLEEEINRYREERDELTSGFTDAEEALSDYMKQLRVFESAFLSEVDKEQRSLQRWEHRCEILEEVIRKLEKAQWGSKELPAAIGPWIQEAEESALPPPPSEPEAPAPPPPLPPEEQKEAKHLYRSLAKRFHPDLVGGGDLQEARRAVMAKINEAYQGNDLESLRCLRHHPDIRDEELESPGEQWERLVREISQLRQRTETARAELGELRQSELGQLMDQLGAEGESGRFESIRALLRQRTAGMMERWRQLRQREAQLWLELDG